eukprot:13236795-Ditylum_brightwellii.AAC.1
MFRKRNAVSSDRILKLNSIGFIWDPLEHAWIEKFNQLRAFKAQNGHCNVPRSDAQNVSLAQWVNKQRVLYKKNAVSSDHIQQLNSIGFVWDYLGLVMNKTNLWHNGSAIKERHTRRTP